MAEKLNSPSLLGANHHDVVANSDLKSVRSTPRVQRKPKTGRIDLPEPNLGQLEAGLSRALAQSSESGRGAAMTALEAILVFIDSVPEWERRNFELPIWALLAALKDLNDGRVVPMLAPNPKVRNRKPDPSMRKILKAYAVSFVDILRRSGLSVTEACRFVAHELKQRNIPLGGRVGSPPWKTVNGWRNGLTKLHINDQTRETVVGLRRELPRLRSFSPEDAKKFVVGQLREIMQTLGKTALE